MGKQERDESDSERDDPQDRPLRNQGEHSGSLDYKGECILGSETVLRFLLMLEFFRAKQASRAE